ncbi:MULTISPECIES: bifunctional diguanylate cyclase/phosphodiesterase [Exiguobacterium]|uniref:Bifunctional diguanylate cyclase/phosphodiesterase n=1 Tax=Exiguobacterium antarcticum TaxID=132920 RepID=A0ABT6QZI0_9BACL|nr:MULTISPECIES: bifunctional diguanylate cyclase/phosphodiesterase [Exiguobacterium]MCT4780572.1 bifunctional diguanylate cyclase/phosphodiesterase [Exiguobacterium soli]MDI3234091.1 bifunctional diguanylate cyclase/phosphodiesterase [Exiguobacterium antarcticum]
MPIQPIDEIVRNQQRWIGNFALFLMSAGALVYLGTTDTVIQNAYLDRSTIVTVLLCIGLITFLISRSQLSNRYQSHLLSIMLLIIPVISISMLPYAAVTVWASCFIFLMIALIAYDRVMIWYALLIIASTNVYVMFRSETVSVEIDPTDHYARLGMIGIAICIALIINHLHLRNLSRLQLLANQLHEAARHDLQTQLLNMRGLEERFSETSHQHLLLVGVHLENYYELARYFGDEIQEQVLLDCIDRLQTRLPPYLTIVRVEGGTLVVVMEKPPGVSCQEEMELLSQQMSAPYQVERHQIYVNLYLVIDDGEVDQTSMTKRIRQITSALQESVQNSEKVMCLNQDWRNEQALRVAAAQALSQADVNRDFYLVYQLQYDSEQERFIGLEALVRWNTTITGAGRPTIFIPIAEKSDLIIRLGEWIFEEGCKTRKQLIGLVSDDFSLSVNVSPRQLTHDSFMAFIERMLLKYSLKPKQIKIEITESQSLDFESQPILRALRRIKTLDFPVSLDDFGTGHASYHVLERLLPLRQLKVPKQFIEQIEESEKRQSILESIFQLSQSMHVECIVEGVETGEEVQIAKDIGIHLFQGYFFAKPVLLDEIICLLKTKQTGLTQK